MDEDFDHAPDFGSLEMHSGGADIIGSAKDYLPSLRLTVTVTPLSFPSLRSESDQRASRGPLLSTENSFYSIEAFGCEILARQNVEGWGSRVIDRPAADLRRDFPEMAGPFATKPHIYARLC